MNTSAGTRVVLYARISEDATGEGLKVSDQLVRCRKFAADQGWEVVAEITDNDVSALKGDERPGYAEVLRLVRLSKVDHVVVWQTSRLLRNRRERAEAIELFGRQRVGIIAVKGISFDLSTAYGRGQAGLMGEFDTMESEVKAERVLAAAAERAAKGRPSGDLGYGWTKQGTGRDATWIEDPHQAGVVREIVDRLLAGETLRGVTETLNARREPSPEAAAWAALDPDEQARRMRTRTRPPASAWGKTAVKKLALRESNIAVRVHHRGRATEARYEGCWPALIDRDKHERVKAVLTDPARRRNGSEMGAKGEGNPTRPGARRHLLSWGVGECGVCGGRLRVVARQGRYGKPTVLYACDAGGCVGRNEAAVDGFVRGVVIARMSQPDALAALLGDDEEARRWMERADALRARIAEADDMFMDGTLTRERLKRITTRLSAELADAQDRARRASALLDVEALRPLAGPHAAQAWDAMTLASRRAVLEALRVRVVIDQTTHRGPVPRDEEGNPVPPGVRIEWR